MYDGERFTGVGVIFDQFWRDSEVVRGVYDGCAYGKVLEVCLVELHLFDEVFGEEVVVGFNCGFRWLEVLRDPAQG